MTNQPLPTRLDTSLRRALGPMVVAALEDVATVELYRNPNGRVWRESHGAGRVELCQMDDAAAEQIVRYAASTMSDAVNRQRPNVAATLFGGRVRFQGSLPPVVASPTFVMRVAGASVIPIETYVERGVMPVMWAQALRSAVAGKGG